MSHKAQTVENLSGSKHSRFGRGFVGFPKNVLS
jgi:hypothetical protein